MKILVICQHYYPEPIPVADVCEHLAASGHEVTVVAGVPNYPMGKVYEGYKNGENRCEMINGVKVYRTFTIARRRGPIWRVLNYYSYSLFSTLFVSRMKEEFDAVLAIQLSPVMMARAAIRYKKKRKKKLLMYSMDLWPECLRFGGIEANNPVFKYYKWVSKRIYRSADRILTSSKSFAEYFKDNFDIEDTEYLPQYADTQFSRELCTKKADGFIDLMFAGNCGAAQSLETIIEAAKLTEDIKNLRWHIVGDGSELEKSKKLAEKLDVSSITFHGRKEIDEMPAYYAMADAMLVTMVGGSAISYTLPRKVNTYMAAGKPILAAADGETAEVIKAANCGICCKPQDAEAFAQSVREFIDSNEKEIMAKNAFEYYCNNFTKEHYFETLERELEKIAVLRDKSKRLHIKPEKAETMQF